MLKPTIYSAHLAYSGRDALFFTSLKYSLVTSAVSLTQFNDLAVGGKARNGA